MNILIVEDEELYADQLQMLIKRLGHHTCAVVDNAEEALIQFDRHSVDMALVDINLKGEMDGLELGKWLRRFSNIPIVFITSHYDNQEYFEKASKVQAFGFIRKPVDETELLRTITLALSYGSGEQSFDGTSLAGKTVQSSPITETLLLQMRSKLVKINQDEILYIEADDKYCTLFLEDGRQFQERGSLREMSKKLSASKFAQSHRSFIVNLDQIQEINTAEFTIKVQEYWIPLGNTYKEYFLKKFGV